MHPCPWIRAMAIGLVGSVQAALTVTVTNGTVEGIKCNNSDAVSYLSIPYALPPLGDLRFSPPQPYNSTFQGTLKATTAAPSCIQFSTALAESGATSEDCLFLDVWVPPSTSSDAGLPVKVWIYGGANTAGGISDPMYDGCNLASDSVVVSINYRLGPLGYLTLPQAGLDGNYAVQDLLLGLQWVQENVGAFGGDKDKVLLFGQSAGANLVFLLSTLPSAPSLFRAAAMESGGGRDFPPAAYVAPFMEAFAANLSCNADDAACLRSRTLTELQLVAAGPDNEAPDAGTLYVSRSFGPIFDGDIVPGQPSTVGLQVPSVLGSTSEEDSLFLLPEYGVTSPPTTANYTDFVDTSFQNLSNQVFTTYPVNQFDTHTSPSYSAMLTIATEYTYLCPAYRALSVANAKNIPVWTYYWNHTNSCPWFSGITKDDLPLLGPTHTSEIPYVFANTFDLPQPSGSCNFTTSEKNISSFLVAAWTSLAASGDIGNANWPAFSNSTTQGILITDQDGDTVAVATTIDYSTCGFWDQIDDAILQNITFAANSTEESLAAMLTHARLDTARLLAISLTTCLLSVWML
ncbi:Alpha/Beta hydrolase protein [Xylariales sp. PMI_506]|nr:Alpha/Beta hydrolase protein [Xylariales sp. PMI_506]